LGSPSSFTWGNEIGIACCEFAFVPASQVDDVALEIGNIPRDSPDVKLDHLEGRCSFESIIREYGLIDHGLLRRAEIVQAADLATHIDPPPPARGVEAIAVAYSLRFPDDEEILSYQVAVNNALYA
jgi:hypothetical protein